jgi:hypothetical protein
VYGQIAAFYAQFNPCGLFVSPELERLLFAIGEKAVRESRVPVKSKSLTKTPKNILHVATSINGIGGHSKMLRRWIQQDTERSHSLVLTQGSWEVLPEILRDAVFNSKGKIYKLNETIGSMTSRSQRLLEIATLADIVVLHIYNYDVIPILAFANKDKSPPIIYLNHTDHNFWVGTSVSDVVVNLRKSGMTLSQKRRGIEAERNAILPSIVDPVHRTLSRVQAKQHLGIPENSIVLLSLARGPKYKTINNANYLDTHIPLLEKYDNTFLVIVGPDINDYINDWSTAIQRMQGRINIIKGREDIAVFYQAADIYVDSFPFVSITSLLEAGTYSLPLVSRYPYSSTASEIFGADMPGLTDNLIRVRSLEEYTKVLSQLIEDEQFRLQLGEATRTKIFKIHVGENWQRYLNDVYHLASNVTKSTAPSIEIDEMFIGEPDVFLPLINVLDIDIENLFKSHLRIMPLNQRLRHWISLVNKYGVHNLGGRFRQLTYLVPEWLICRIRKFYK